MPVSDVNNACMQGTEHLDIWASLKKRLEKRPEFFTHLLCAHSWEAWTQTSYKSQRFLIWLAHFVVGLFALGVFVILAAGGIDVSFTAIAALSMYTVTNLVVSFFLTPHIALVFLASAMGGALLGMINGFLVHELRSAFINCDHWYPVPLSGFLLSFVGTVWIPRSPHRSGVQPANHLATAFNRLLGKMVAAADPAIPCRADANPAWAYRNRHCRA